MPKKDLRDLDDDFLVCRLRHSWEFKGVVRQGNERHLVYHCSGCTTDLTQVLSSAGKIIRNHYHYPEGYLLKGGVQHVDVRREVLRRY